MDFFTEEEIQTLFGESTQGSQKKELAPHFQLNVEECQKRCGLV